MYASLLTDVKEGTSRFGQCFVFIKKRMRKMFFRCGVLLFSIPLVQAVILMTTCQLLLIQGQKDKPKRLLQ